MSGYAIIYSADKFDYDDSQPFSRVALSIKYTSNGKYVINDLAIHRHVLDTLLEENNSRLFSVKKSDLYAIIPPIVVEISDKSIDRAMYEAYYHEYSTNFQSLYGEVMVDMMKFNNPVLYLTSSDECEFYKCLFEKIDTLIVDLKQFGYTLQDVDSSEFLLRIKGPARYMRLSRDDSGKSNLLIIGPYTGGVMFK